MKAKISPHQGIVPVHDRAFPLEIKTLESALEYDCNIEIVTKLMQLYTLAIENYESVKDPTYSLYKQKMKNLLSRPDVQHSITSSSKTEPQSPTIISRPRASTIDNNRHRLELSTERIAAKALQWHNCENCMTGEKIQENLKRQIENFNLRLNSRKKKTERNAKILEFEKGVEEIMEEFIKLKEKARDEVEEKYRECIAELKAMEKNEVILKVVRETERRIEEEIIEKIREVEILKRKKIQKLKGVVKLTI